jgi:predicted GIY-YIG superfamily endonuclease
MNTGSFPKALSGKKSQSLATVMKMDKKADAKMGPKQIKADIAADKKNLASKTKKK